MSIRTRLFFSFLGIAVAVLIPVSLLSVEQVLRQSRDAATAATLREMAQIDQTITTYLSTVDRNVDFMAQHESIARLGESVTDYLQNGGLVRPRSDDSIGQSATAFLGRIADANPEYLDVFAATLQGGFLSGSVGLLLPDPYDPRQTPWFEQALDGQKSTTAFPDAGGRGPCIARMRVLQNQDGLLSGVIGVEIPLTSLTQQLNRVRLGENGWIMLLQSDSTVLASPADSSWLFRKGTDVPGIPLQDSLLQKASIQGVAYYTIGYTSPVSDWRYVGFIPREEVQGPVWSILKRMAFFSVAILVVVLVVAVWIGHFLARPLSDVSSRMAEIAEGAADLTRRLDHHSQDEIGVLAGSFNKLQERLSSMVAGIQQDSHSVLDVTSGASREFTIISEQMQETVASVDEARCAVQDTQSNMLQVDHVIAEVRSRSQALAAQGSGVREILSEVVNAVADLNHSLADVARREELLDERMDGVSTSVTRMGEEILLIGRDTVSARQVAATAQEKAREATSAMESLERTAVQIGRVIELIQNVAAQTNLLALNASIEAASAGAAGKGFAVVAAEVKDLARQTATATGEIQENIAAIQQEALRSARSLDQVVGVIGKIHDLNSSIAESVEIQNSRAQSISGEIYGLSVEVRQFGCELREKARTAERVSQEVEGAGSQMNAMEQDIASVSEGVGNIEVRAGNVHDAMNGITQCLSKLRSLSEHSTHSITNGNSLIKQLHHEGQQLQERVGLFVVEMQPPRETDDLSETISS